MTTATVAELDALIEDLTVDAYDDEEQLSGFLVGAQDALGRSEHATIIGVAWRPADESRIMAGSFPR